MISLSELARVMHTNGIRNLLPALGNEHITRHGPAQLSGTGQVKRRLPERYLRARADP